MNKYQQLQKVGSGNFSAVHLVRNLETGQTAAMKIMKTHQNIALKQAYFLKNFDHPNIVRLLDFEQDAARGETRIVLEYLPENTLELYEQQQFGLREEQVKCILFQTALGLAYVHERGIIHRDIKPQNILIDKRKAEIKLIDFGLAVSLEKVATDYVATRWYRAPENLLGTKQYSCLIDVFSLACVIVELYLGNPLFPGADNIDQLYRIFNILGEPTQTSWPAGVKKFREMGFNNDSSRGQKKGDDSFGLKSLLKACSQGLVTLLQKMLVLNPKKRITTRQIVLDPYFTDVKSIIPPSIYKRFEKDHYLKKTTSKEAIQNAESFINNTRSKLSKIQLEKEDSPHFNLQPNINESLGNNCNLINYALSPKKNNIQQEQAQLKDNDFRKIGGLHALSPKQPNHNALKPPHQQLSNNNNNNNQPQQPSILAFRGFNPIKNNKISVKQTRKNQQSHSHHKLSRDNSMQSIKSKGKQKFISNSIDLGKKILNSSNRFAQQPIKIERKMTNQREYRTPDVKNNSLQKGSKVLYYFQGDKPKAVSPLKIIIPGRQNYPIQQSVRMEQKNNSFLASESVRMTRNNSAINLPSIRMAAPQTRSILQPKQRERISHSPGINLTQIQRENMSRLQPKRQEFYPQESVYVTNNRPAYEKLKIITNVVAAPPPNFQQQGRSRNDRSQDQSVLNLSGLESAQPSVLRGGERVLQFKEKVLSHGNRQLIPANYPHKPHFFEPISEKQHNASISKLKHYKSVQRMEPFENQQQKYLGNVGDKKEPFSIGQFKTLHIDDRRDYRQPRIGTKKTDVTKFTQILTSPREKNININLNVSIIDAEGKEKSQISMQNNQNKRNRI